VTHDEELRRAQEEKRARERAEERAAPTGSSRPRSVPVLRGFAGEQLLALLEREPLPPPYAGVPIPGHFTLLIAPPFAGKTSLQLWLAMSRAAGVAPWEFAPQPEAGRVLYLSPDESVERVVRRMRQLSTFHPARLLEQYIERIEVLGPDRDTDSRALGLCRFDREGLRALRYRLEHASDFEGQPFAEVYFDSWNDFRPAGMSENDNGAAGEIGMTLEALAVETGTAIHGSHHAVRVRFEVGEEPMDPRDLGRGASALAAKARAVTGLYEVKGMPRFRTLRMRTNLGAEPKLVELEVAGEKSGPQDILYFRAHDPIAAFPPSEYVQEGEAITTNELARRLAGLEQDDATEPTGEIKRRASRLREAWLERDLVRVVPGPNRSKLISLRGAGL
jgi:hypothetical protein